MNGAMRYARVSRAGGAFAWAGLDAGTGRASLLDAAPWLGGRPVGDETVGWPGPLQPPVEPTKILCIGRNYRAHAAELGNDVPKEPLLFLKPPSSLLAPGGTVVLPPQSVSRRVDYEAEVAVVIGTRGRHIAHTRALEHVFGATLALDVTARDLQKSDGQWTRAKGMDTFCPVGPHVVPGADLARLTFSCRVNGDVRQRGDTRNMIFGVADLIAYTSRFFTLEPGDILLTGTPEGVGPLSAGDVIEVDSDAIGATLRVSVAADRAGTS